MDSAKKHILENNTSELILLLNSEYKDADPDKIEILRSYPDLAAWEEYDPIMDAKVKEVNQMVDYAIILKREKCLQVILRQFCWIETGLITKILLSGLHFDFVKKILSSDFNVVSIINNIIWETETDSAEISIAGLETLFQYIPSCLHEMCALHIIRMFNNNFLPYLQRLDTFLNQYVVDHSIFEKRVLGFCSFHKNTPIILEFIKQTPQYDWIDSDGNGFFHYASQNNKNTAVFSL